MAADPTILLLAAGRATRMRGSDKLLEDVNGEPLLFRMASRAAKVAQTRVVLGPDQPARRAALANLPVDLIEAPAGAGMAASIVSGVSGLACPVLILLADMPDITANDLHLLIALSRQAPDIIFRAATPDGRPGNPVLFPAQMIPELKKIQGDQGARDLLTREEHRIHLVPLKDDRALVDLDTPEDWAAWRQKKRSNPFL